MVQVKKDEIKKAIENSAIDIFLEKGYIDTKMKHIATKANISVGNIYIYFKNKEDLFYTVLPKSFADSFGNFNYNIFTILTEVFINNPQDIEKYIPTDERIDYLIANRKRLLILLRYSKGTIYENLKEEMIENIIQCQSVFLQKSGLLDNCNIGKKFKIIRMVFGNMLNMLLDSLEGDIDVEERRYIIKFSYEYNLCGFKRLVKEYVK